MRFLFFLLFIFISLNSVGQNTEFCSSDVKTARILKVGEDFGYPICALDEYLQLSFDVLDDNYNRLTYRIFHCDADLNIDDLQFTDYAEGFDNLPLDDYNSSFNTLQKFSHYSLTIPNNDIKLTISGNYIIKIYDDEENVILSKFFMIYDDTKNLEIKSNVKKPLSAEFSFNYQQVEVSLDNSRARIANPEKYVKVFVMQNNNFFSRKKLEISYLNSSEIQYFKNFGNNIFSGGVEFLFFDAKDVNFTPLGVDKILYQNGLYNYYLSVDEAVDLSYSYKTDLNGNYYIKNDRGFDNNLESDYVNVWFKLKYDRFADGDIYVCGNFSNYLLTDEYKLIFNPETKFYECKQFLKQGLYNYQYIFLSSDGNISYPFGSWYNTENDYLVCVYVSDFSKLGDRLELCKIINSQKN